MEGTPVTVQTGSERCACGYPLSQLPFNHERLRVCPECGRAERLRAPGVAPGPCRRCGYDLSGTPVRGDGVAWVCPECRFVSRLEDWDTPRDKRPRGTGPKWSWLAAVTLVNAVLVVPLVVFTPACGGVWPVSLALGAAVFLAEGAALERRHCTGTGAAFRTRPVLTNALLLCAAAAAIYWFVVMAWSVNRPKWL